MRVGAAKLVGFYPPAKLHAVMRRAAPRLGACFRPPLATRVRLKFTIEPNGTVTQVSVPSEDVADATVRVCLEGVVQGLTFDPTPDIGLETGVTPVQVTYPIGFHQ